MADAVAGAGKADPVLFRYGLYVAVVVGVFKAGLQGVVVNIGDREFGPDLPDPHGFKLQVGHGTGSVLRQGLIDAEPDFTAGRHIPADQVAADDFLGKRVAHTILLFHRFSGLLVGWAVPANGIFRPGAGRGQAGSGFSRREPGGVTEPFGKGSCMPGLPRLWGRWTSHKCR